MRTRKGASTAVAALLGVLGVGLAISTTGSAAPARPGFVLGVSPVAESVRQGQTAAYAVTASAAGSFAGVVSLTASGTPTGATTTFTPGRLALSTSVSSRTSTLTVSAGARTPIGTYPMSITGVSGTLHRSVSVRLTVHTVLPPSLALSMSPTSVTVAAGSPASFSVAINRTGSAGRVALAAVGPFPPGISASVQPDPTTGSSATVLLTTSPSTKDGTYPVHVIGWSVADGTVKVARAQADLVVSTPKNRSFTISGNLVGNLAPGVPARPLNLTVTNPDNQRLAIANLTVAVSGTSAGAACGPENFVVTQYRGGYPLNLGARQTASLSQLGAATSALPTVGMRDLPANQDACKGVTVHLGYSGSGQGA
jgi:hypothetical protein